VYSRLYSCPTTAIREAIEKDSLSTPEEVRTPSAAHLLTSRTHAGMSTKQDNCAMSETNEGLRGGHVLLSPLLLNGSVRNASQNVHSSD
jgi:hypothetical protein